jgi:Heparinase II/III N-terminus/Heparinase II/III-like protein
LKRPFTIREKIEGMTARELAGEALLRARRRISRAMNRATDKPNSTYVSDEALRRSLNGKSVAEVAARIRDHDQPRLLPGLADLARTAATIKELSPESIEEARREADAILGHRITLFGRVHDLGRRIDWHRDPMSGASWPLEHFTRTRLSPVNGADVRVVWELNRLQHFTTLGRAYALTSDERYAEEFLLQLASWYEDNSPRFGVNWTVAMEAAIRAVNIIAALEMFRGSAHVNDEAIGLILKILIAHGRFIRANLEFSNRASSNHYLSDLIGMFVIGTALPELRESRGWASYSSRRLLEEMDRQVLADGVDYEGAIGYHRFVLEIFALFFSMSSARGIEIPRRYWERLETMFDFVRHYLKPDGTAPLIGDSDDGRLIKFEARSADDHSYLMSIAAVLKKSDRFKQSSRIDQEAVWWFGNEGRETFDRLAINERPATSQAFPAAQVFIQRAELPENRGPLYAIIDCGDHGARGRGSHAHSDALSLEIFAFNRTFLRDPGTFVYSASQESRNLFRSTAYHNTVRVDREEISQVHEGELFAFASNVQPRVNRWESNAERDVLDAEHHAYTRLPEPVTHRRVITFDKREGCWIIEDVFTGEGRHSFEFFFNFDAGLEVEIDADNRAIARDQNSALTIVPFCDLELEARIEPRSVSPSYGTRLNSSAIIFGLAAETPLRVRFQLLLSRTREQLTTDRGLRTS